jgi:hypothetical protein
MYDFEDIDDYLNDRMSAPDRTAFEHALATDPDLVERVDALRAEGKVFRLLRDEQLLTKFSAWEKEREDDVITGNWNWIKRIGLQKFWWLFAGLTGLAVVGIIVYKTVIKPQNTTPDGQNAPLSQPPSNQPIVRQAPDTTIPPDKSIGPNPKLRYEALTTLVYKDHTFKTVPMGQGQEVKETDYIKAVQLYESRQYASALKLLQTVDTVQKLQYLLLRAYTRYHLQQYVEAERDFRVIRESNSPFLIYDAQWGEVFCLVRQLPSVSARKRLDAHLKDMAHVDHPYHKDAAILEKALKKIESER